MAALHPDRDVDRHLRDGLAGTIARDWAAVEAASSAALARDPVAPVALLQRGLVCLVRGDRSAAERAIRAGQAGIPGFDRYRLDDDAQRAAGRWSPMRSFISAMHIYVIFRTHDVFFVEFPKCGRTWLRLMVDDALARTRTGAPETALPAIHVWHDDRPHWKGADAIVADKSIYADKKVLLQVRDPRDVVVSNYFQLTRRGDGKDSNNAFAGDLSAYLRHARGSIDSILRFYNVWADARRVPAALHRVRYEDLLADCPGTLAGVLDFIGLPPLGASTVREIADAFSFDRMRAMEISGAIESSTMRPGDVSDPESYKVRRGRAGGFRDYLTADDIAFLDRRIAAELDEWYGEYRQPALATTPASP
jgi:hypothetical protein